MHTVEIRIEAAQLTRHTPHEDRFHYTPTDGFAAVSRRAAIRLVVANQKMMMNVTITGYWWTRPAFPRTDSKQHRIVRGGKVSRVPTKQLSS